MGQEINGKRNRARSVKGIYKMVASSLCFRTVSLFSSAFDTCPTSGVFLFANRRSLDADMRFASERWQTLEHDRSERVQSSRRNSRAAPSGICCHKPAQWFPLSGNFVFFCFAAVSAASSWPRRCFRNGREMNSEGRIVDLHVKRRCFRFVVRSTSPLCKLLFFWIGLRTW